MLILTNADTLVLQYALRGALSELSLTQADFAELLAVRGVVYEPGNLSRTLQKAKRLKAVTALQLIDALLECARSRDRVFYTGRPEGLRFWAFQGTGAVFRPAHCTGNSVSWDDMLQCINTASYCSTIYYLRSSFAEFAGIALAIDPAERSQDIKTANARSAERIDTFLQQRKVQLGA